MKSFTTASLLAFVLISPCAVGQVTLFDHDFANAPSPGNAVNSVSDLGAPAAGSFSFSGSPVGGIGSSNTTRRALAVSHREFGDVDNMTEMVRNTVVFSVINFPDTQVADSGGGDRVFADFATPGGFTGGASTSISFRLANFGNSNTSAFKYSFVRGLDASDNEVFELLFVAGSSSGTREVFARGANDDETTLALNENDVLVGTPEGTKLVDSSSFNLNGTDVATGRPSGTWMANLTLANGVVTYDIGADGGVASTADNGVTGFPINSSATSIAKLEFSAVWDSLANEQNKGYWIDEILAETSSGAASLLGADFNNDGAVDLLDLDILGQNWQMTGDALAGDANADGVVDLLDLDILGSQWQGSSFAEALAASGIAVPEPASLVTLISIGLLAKARCRRLA